MPGFPLHLALLILLALSCALPAEDQPYDYATWRQFWSFKPVVKPVAPRVQDEKWVRNPIDAFILAKLEAQKMSPSSQADRYTLLRRATFDLTGLPPTLAEIDAFIKDDAPDAYEKVIRRLLDSPHYGERYGRHWLDVTRYEQGQVKLRGLKNTRGELDFRDYIVRAFNKDKPFNQLLTEHLAGDLLPAAPDREQQFDQVSAPMFLSIGNWFDQCTDPNRLKLDMADEQINAVSKAFLGLTIACARCHDHKFDPITAKDYYALAGVFASTRIVDAFNEDWQDGRFRLLREQAMPEEVAANDAIRARVAARRAEEWTALQSTHAMRMKKWKDDEPIYRRLASQAPKVQVNEFEAEDFAGQSNLKISKVQIEGETIEFIETQKVGEQWVKYEVTAPAAGMYTFWALYTAGEDVPVTVQVGGESDDEKARTTDTGGWDWSHRAWRHMGEFDLVEGVNTIRIEVKDGRFPRLDRIRWYATNQLDIPRLLSALRESITDWDGFDLRTLIGFVLSPKAPYLTVAEVAPPIRVKGSSRDIALQIRRYPQLIGVVDYEKPTDLPVHIGGDTYRVSKSLVPRAAPVLFEHAVKPPVMPQTGSGRLELARWMADANHPLTSRVIVNRLWQWHFGRGIVDTANDFGSRGAAPTHPELLDWLAATFVEEGWSMKKLHYTIMTSATYRQEARQAGAGRPAVGGQEAHAPGLLSHFPRRRLEVEAIYDAMLAATGKVARQPGGQPLDFAKSADRMMYVLTSGRSPQGLGGEVRKMFSVFDYDPTGEPIARRETSNTSAQALFWINNPIPKHFAAVLARQLVALDTMSDSQRLDRAYLLAIGREPSKDVRAAALEFIAEQAMAGQGGEEIWTQVCVAIFASNEFRYLD